MPSVAAYLPSTTSTSVAGSVSSSSSVPSFFSSAQTLMVSAGMKNSSRNGNTLLSCSRLARFCRKKRSCQNAAPALMKMNSVMNTYPVGLLKYIRRSRLATARITLRLGLPIIARAPSSSHASRLAALLLGRICPMCSLVAPCHPGAWPLLLRRGVSPLSPQDWSDGALAAGCDGFAAAAGGGAGGSAGGGADAAASGAGVDGAGGGAAWPRLVRR